MRKRPRNLMRTRGKRVLNSYSRLVCHYAYAQNSALWQDWNFRTISQRVALQLVADGEATPVTRMVALIVHTVGYQALKPTSWERPSATTLTFATTNAVANAVAKEGTTPRLTRREREEIFKFKVWPLIRDNKAVSVCPRISDAERAESESLLPVSSASRKLLRKAA